MFSVWAPLCLWLAHRWTRSCSLLLLRPWRGSTDELVKHLLRTDGPRQLRFHPRTFDSRPIGWGNMLNGLRWHWPFSSFTHIFIFLHHARGLAAKKVVKHVTCTFGFYLHSTCLSHGAPQAAGGGAWSGTCFCWGWIDVFIPTNTQVEIRGKKRSMTKA